MSQTDKKEKKRKEKKKNLAVLQEEVEDLGRGLEVGMGQRAAAFQDFAQVRPAAVPVRIGRRRRRRRGRRVHRVGGVRSAKLPTCAHNQFRYRVLPSFTEFYRVSIDASVPFIVFIICVLRIQFRYGTIIDE